MRFEEIISEVPVCGTLAEVGCDHARLTELALRRGLCRSAVVSDISAACLEKARRTLSGYDCVRYIVCDGVPEGVEPDCLLVCGMGGHNVRDILSRYRGRATLVLSPQSHAELVREALPGMGYAIERDRCFEAAGKYYDVIRAVKTDNPAQPDGMQIKYGACYKEKNPALRARLERLLGCLRGGGDANAARIAEITEVLSWQK